MTNWTDAHTARRERLALIQRILEVQRQLSERLGRPATVEEIAREIGFAGLQAAGT